MTKVRLTARRIRDLRTDPDKTTFVWDATLPAFGIRVSKGGVASFVLWVRYGAKKKLLTLGRVDVLSIDAARKAASAELDALGRGGADLGARRAAMTVSAGCEWFLNTHIPRRQGLGKMSVRTATEYQRQIRAYILPAVGHLKIESVTRQNIESLLDGIGWDKPAMFSRVRSLIRSAFNVFEVQGWRREGTNPGTRITVPTERERTRTLSGNEQTSFFLALGRLGDDAAARAIKFLFQTGCRLDEARTLQWDQVDSESMRARLPRTKTGPKTLHLTNEAMATVSASPRPAGNAFVFAGAGNSPMAGATIRRRFHRAARLAGIEDVKPHDLRRTFITEIVNEGVPLPTVAALVGHSTIVMTAKYAKTAASQVREAGEILATARRKRQGAEVVAMGERRA